MAKETVAVAPQATLFGKIKSVRPFWWQQLPAQGGGADSLARPSPPPGRRHGGALAAAALEAPPVGERGAAGGERGGGPEGAAAPAPPDAPTFGYARLPEGRFRVERELGRGGNGVVTLVTDLSSGKQWAMKSLPKALPAGDPGVSAAKRAGHADAIAREVEVLRRLRGCLNVAALEEAYEDDNHVHLLIEHCSGGELHHRIGDRPYSERTVASFMRAVLRTLAQCHSQRILHRDVKPGNFMLASPDDRAPLKAIDFGLAVFFDPEALPRTDLGLEGTPWFMAPEALRSEAYPASDVWAAGVMAHQLLTGRFPFDDRQSPWAPSLSKVWKAILCDDVDFRHRGWEGVSEEARSFVALLLDKDPAARPTAREALAHPWLRGSVGERGRGRPLSLGVVQRIQRFSQGSAFKRGVLEHIAHELLAADPPAPAPGEDGAGAGAVCRLGKGGAPLIADPADSPLEFLYERLGLQGPAAVADRAAVAKCLGELGYRLSPEELERLLDQLDPGATGAVTKAQLAASQLDWRELQRNQTERWLECVRKAFEDLDTDGNGRIGRGEMVAFLRGKLPPEEVQAAVRHALAEARNRSEASRHGGPEARERGAVAASPFDADGGASVHSAGSAGENDSTRSGLTFKHLVRVLRAGSADSLELYDDRLGSSFGSPGGCSLAAAADKSLRGAESVRSTLEPIPERG